MARGDSAPSLMSQSTKRSYNRRSEEQLIADLEAKMLELRRRVEAKSRQDQALVKELPKLQRRLRDFAQLAADHAREDIANSTLAFMAGLERMAHHVLDEPRRRGRAAAEDHQDEQD